MDLEVHIPGAETRYPLRFGNGLLDSLGAAVGALRPTGVALVTDENVARHHLERARASFDRPPALEVVLPPGEETKTLPAAARLLDRLVESSFDRRAVVVALGGGVVGDLAGFAAATYLRGVRIVMVPTTLLAQVDSSVGGKVGVDHPLGKNLIGAFHQPALVLVDSAVLETLPLRERSAGMAEVVKYGLIASVPLFETLEREVDRWPPSIEVVAECCRIKARIVALDEKESGPRRVLNFGHTFAHAIEAATAYSVYRHGEAVALGMRAALDLSIEIGGLARQEAVRARALVERLELPDLPLPTDRDRLAAAVRRDKKAEGGRVHAVVLEAIGRAATREVEVERIVEGVRSLSQ